MALESARLRGESSDVDEFAFLFSFDFSLKVLFVEDVSPNHNLLVTEPRGEGEKIFKGSVEFNVTLFCGKLA